MRKRSKDDLGVLNMIPTEPVQQGTNVQGTNVQGTEVQGTEVRNL